MILEETSDLEGYELLDSGEGYRLEKYGDFVLARPDPAVLWRKSAPALWQKADAVFERGQDEERGRWKLKSKVPEKWLLNYKNGSYEIKFFAKLTAFKHTGIFPEQKANWDFIAEKSPSGERLKFLNLFGYTGIASVLAAKLGHEVTHVDASRPALTWAKENMLASGLPENAIRWIFEDCLKFVKREVRRGNKYDAIILDPPAFGRGPKGEVWKFSEELPKLLAEVAQLCSADFKYLIVNAYAVSVSSLLLKNLLEDLKTEASLGSDRKIDYGELVLREHSGRLLSTGIFARLY